MSTKSSTWFVVAVASAVAFPVSCGRRLEVNKVAVILSLSGAAAPYGQDNLKGLELAERLRDSDQGPGDIQLDVQDDAGDPAQAVTLARRFAADPSVCAIIGPTRTGSTVAVSALLPQLQIPMISVGSTGDWESAAKSPFNEWTFRSTRVDTYLIEPLLRTARDSLGVKRLAAIYTSDDDWSTSVMAVYERVISSLGLQLVAKESQRTGDTDRSPQLTNIKLLNPDALIINVLATDAPTIASQARRMGITGRFLGTAGFTNPQTWGLADPGALNGTLVAENFYPESPRPAVQAFVQQYRGRFSSEPPPYAAYAYDGMRLFMHAYSRAGGCNRKAIRDALGSTRDFEGVLGVLTYSGSGDAQKTPVILEIRGGRLQLFAQ